MLQIIEENPKRYRFQPDEIHLTKRSLTLIKFLKSDTFLIPFAFGLMGLIAAGGPHLLWRFHIISPEATILLSESPDILKHLASDSHEKDGVTVYAVRPHRITYEKDGMIRNVRKEIYSHKELLSDHNLSLLATTSNCPREYPDQDDMGIYLNSIDQDKDLKYCVYLAQKLSDAHSPPRLHSYELDHVGDSLSRMLKPIPMIIERDISYAQ